jgi:CRP/FNR family transcriptional regulator, cyclic AMP receptor protein
MERLEALRKCVLFADLNQAELGSIAGATTEASYKPGEFVFQQGDLGDCMYVIISGAVNLRYQGLNGEVLSIGERHTHDTFGELSLLDGLERSASVEAVVDSNLLVLTKDVLLSLLQRKPSMIPPLLAILSRMVRETTLAEASRYYTQR